MVREVPTVELVRDSWIPSNSRESLRLARTDSAVVGVMGWIGSDDSHSWKWMVYMCPPLYFQGSFNRVGICLSIEESIAEASDAVVELIAQYVEQERITGSVRKRVKEKVSDFVESSGIVA